MNGTISEQTPRGVGFWIGLALGLPIMAYGVVGAATNAGTHPIKLATWIVGADLIHDLLVAPVVGLVGWLLVKVARRPWRAPLRAALITTALIVAIGWVPLRGYGRIADNRSLAPLDYATTILTAVGAVWLACAVWIAAVAVRGRTNVSQNPTPDSPHPTG